jgi:putative aminopeptidase FrvX
MNKEENMNTTLSGLRATLADLVSLPGVSGFEQEVVSYVRDRFARTADSVSVDRYGNVVGRKIGQQEGPLLMISAHMDEIGFIVKSIQPDGFLRLDRIGGAGDGILSCRQVKVSGHIGLIGSLSGHLGSAEALARVPTLRELYVDVGASSATEVANMGIQIGDPVSFVGDLKGFSSDHLVFGKSMDNRAGLAILIQLMEELKGTELFSSFAAVATVLEQIGFRGAGMVATQLRPDYAISIDGVAAADTPDLSLIHDIPVSLGRGPVVVIASATKGNKNIGTIAHPAMKRYLLNTATKEKIDVQVVNLLDRASTEAAVIHLANGGVPTINVGVPRRYSYSPHEMINLNDAAKAVKLLKAFVCGMAEHNDFRFV